MRTKIKFQTNKLLIAVLMLILLYGCEKQDGNNTPVVQTLEVKDITDKTAVTINLVSDDGGTMVTVRGVCWSKNQTPTINDSKTEDGNGKGSFAASITSLEPSTTYHVRAYAINSVGTSYGNQMTFTTFTAQNPDGTTGTVTYDGYTYKTVYIGGREWMAENLRTTKYYDGTSIPIGYSITDWATLTTGAYTVYPHIEINGLNTDAQVLAAYGALYNWYAVNTGKLCPSGWSVPTDAEWTALTDYAGGVSVAGGKLKSTRTDPNTHPRWDSPNTGATDEYGFSALPAGDRGSDGGEFSGIGSIGFWWSSTEYSPTSARARRMIYGVNYIGTGYHFKEWGFSVRCVRDN